MFSPKKKVIDAKDDKPLSPNGNKQPTTKDIKPTKDNKIVDKTIAKSDKDKSKMESKENKEKKPSIVVATAPPQSPTPTSSKKPMKSAYDTPDSPIASASPTAVRRMRLKVDRTPTAGTSSTSSSSSTTTTSEEPKKTVARRLTTEAEFQAQPAAAQPTTMPANTVAPTAATSTSTIPIPKKDGKRPSLVAQQPDPKQPTIFSPVYTRHDADEEKAKENGKDATHNVHGHKPRFYQTPLQVQAAKAKAMQQANQNREGGDMDDEYGDEDEFDPFLFIKNLPPLTEEMKNRISPLPKKRSNRNCLALDLDETLVHCSVQPIEKAELTFTVNFNGCDYEVYVRTRPHLHAFLEQVAEWFEIVVFTASQKVYADKLLDILDPEKKFVQHRVFRDSCVCVDGNYLKDLNILGRDMNCIAIVDNSVQAFGYQLDNGIPIESWFDDDSDNELLNLIPFLRTLKDVKDVRPLIKDTFKLTEFVNSL